MLSSGRPRPALIIALRARSLFLSLLAASAVMGCAESHRLEPGIFRDAGADGAVECVVGGCPPDSYCCLDATGRAVCQSTGTDGDGGSGEGIPAPPFLPPEPIDAGAADGGSGDPPPPSDGGTDERPIIPPLCSAAP